MYLLDARPGLAAGHGNTVAVSVTELRELSADIATALASQLITPKLQQAIGTLGGADGIIAAAPVYKAGPSGLFTSFFQVLDNDLLIGKPVLLAATAGTAGTPSPPTARCAPVRLPAHPDRADLAVRRPRRLE